MFSAQGFHALRKTTTERSRSSQTPTEFSSNDTLILFGELFNRGYANGLVEAAQSKGMKIIYSTVGRRDKEMSLRPLNSEELIASPSPLINIPLEAGFDLESDASGVSPVSRAQDTKLSEWQNCKIPTKSLNESLQKGRERFRNNVKNYITELRKLNPTGNLYFAHLMAGGVPRAKIIMPLMNRSVKGTGERFLSSETFWTSDLGNFCKLSFEEVTAETFKILIEETEALRNEKKVQGFNVSYSAYGYHGTEVFNGENFDWQTYTPYLQGWAKIKLEDYSKEFFNQGIKCAVYNCPEILTNSSSIFQGVEIPLYPLLAAFKKINPDHPFTQEIWSSCKLKLKSGVTIENILDVCKKILHDTEFREHCDFKKWPQHNSKTQLEKVLLASEELSSMHLDSKLLMTSLLSELVFTACGRQMLSDITNPESPVSWIGHDVIAKELLEAKS